jgi:MinD-like ATPase involved in chromosome partitioning or flagellar assembly
MHVVMFYNAKGGVGKSTLAANVAWLISHMYQTLVMDFSTADRTTTLMLAGPCKARGIYDVLFQFGEAYGRGLEVETCETGRPGLEVLPPGSMEKAVLQLDYYVLAKRVDILMNIARHFAYTIADYPGRSIYTDPLLQALLRHVDHLILVTHATQSSINEATDVHHFVLQKYKPPPVVSIVTNMYMGEKTYEETLKTPGGFAMRIPADPVVFALGRIPQLQIDKDKVSGEWKKAVKQLAEFIIRVRMARRHTVATYFP